MACILRVSGRDFAALEYSRRTTLPVVHSYGRGQPRLPRTQPRGRKNRTSGVNIEVSRADFHNLKRQIADAIAFLERHHRQLVRLSRTAGVEELTLDFGVADRDVAGQFDRFPPELVAAAGRLGMGIEISRYHAFSEG